MKLTVAKQHLTEIKPQQFLVDEKGKKVAVVLDIKTFERLLEEIEDFYFGTMAEAELKCAQEYVSHDVVESKFKRTKKKRA